MNEVHSDLRWELFSRKERSGKRRRGEGEDGWTCCFCPADKTVRSRHGSEDICGYLRASQKVEGCGGAGEKMGSRGAWDLRFKTRI